MRQVVRDPQPLIQRLPLECVLDLEDVTPAVEPVVRVIDVVRHPWFAFVRWLSSRPLAGRARWLSVQPPVATGLDSADTSVSAGSRHLVYRRGVSEPREPATPAADVGRLVAGRYRLAELIGVGGMATVHRATDTRFDRTVAVKLLRREVVEDADIAMRFRREALAATVLRHPNIVGCLETGTDDGQPFLVMELIEGEDLAARLRRVGRLSAGEATRIGLDVARALGVAHIRGIVHRDVKPGNILLARDGRAMVTDFGIARLSADAEGAVPGTTLGSVHYFSPEQAKGETTTAASDVYSLGLVLYESLTGRRAWSGESTAKLAAARIGAPAPHPRDVSPDVPAALDSIVAHALDPEPAGRYPNGQAFASALESLVTHADPSSPTVATDQAALAAAAAALAHGAPSSVGVAPPMPGSVAPLRPAPAGPTGRAGLATARPAGLGAVRRASPVIAAPLMVLLLVVGVVVAALLLAALPGGGSTGVAFASPTPRATQRPTARPTARPSARPSASAVPGATAVAKPASTPDPGIGPEATESGDARCLRSVLRGRLRPRRRSV